jgi:hypothetical protein
MSVAIHEDPTARHIARSTDMMNEAATAQTAKLRKLEEDLAARQAAFEKARRESIETLDEYKSQLFAAARVAAVLEGLHNLKTRAAGVTPETLNLAEVCAPFGAGEEAVRWALTELAIAETVARHIDPLIEAQERELTERKAELVASAKRHGFDPVALVAAARAGGDAPFHTSEAIAFAVAEALKSGAK